MRCGIENGYSLVFQRLCGVLISNRKDAELLNSKKALSVFSENLFL